MSATGWIAFLAGSMIGLIVLGLLAYGAFRLITGGSDDEERQE